MATTVVDSRGLGLFLYYRPQWSWGKVMFLQVSVILLVEGVCLSACWDTIPCPQEQTPPQSRHPPLQSMVGDTVNAQAVRILLECNLVITIFTDGGPYILIFVAILEEFSFIYAKPLRNSI